MSGGDMDDASSALIAKLLMQDQLGSDYDPELFGSIGGDADDDYIAPGGGSRGRKRSANSTPAKRGRKAADPPAAAPAAPPPAPTPADEEIDLAKPAGEAPPKAEGSNGDKISRGGAGFYTDEEEKKFLAGLELYGRDWGKLSAHVGTRDRNSVRSHTQKYFLRLYRSGLPLPAKVLETGAGYTLSGKPLDPNSAAARPYMQASVPHAPPPDQGAPVPEFVSESEPKPKPVRTPKRKEPSPPPAPVPTSEVVLGRTRYAKDRLRQNTSITVQHLREMTTKDPLTLVKSVGIDEGDEPYTLSVHANALLVVDFHAHLSNSEIIGFLGGHWHADSRRLIVTEAFPCETVAGNDGINVEMSPESDVAVREEIQSKSLRVVGWYHSHPVFQPDPSIRDIENQASYQHLCRDHNTGLEPFVGLIISPYDVHLPTEVSQVNYFIVQKPKNEAMGIPTALSVTNVPDAEIPDHIIARLDSLAEFYATFSDRTNLEELWRYFAPPAENAGGVAPPLKPLSKLQKLELCLLSRFQRSLPADAAAKHTTRIIQELHKWTKKT